MQPLLFEPTARAARQPRPEPSSPRARGSVTTPPALRARGSVTTPPALFAQVTASEQAAAGTRGAALLQAQRSAPPLRLVQPTPATEQRAAALAAARGQAVTSMPSEGARARSIVAIVLPELPCELAQTELLVHLQALHGAKLPTQQARQRIARQPLGVLIEAAGAGVDAGGDAGVDAGSTTDGFGVRARLGAVNEAALRLGVRPGQRVSEACAQASHLLVRRVSVASLEEALGRVAELALRFGAPVSIEAPDVVWVDATTSAHLFGGAAEVARELLESVRALGHSSWVAVANGPLLARIFARWVAPRQREGYVVVDAASSARLLGQLELGVLPLGAEQVAWLSRAGVFTVARLAGLPTAATLSRLEELSTGTGRVGARTLLELVEGKDESPLVAYTPPHSLLEQARWEEPLGGVEPLLFVLRGLAARVSARLEGRGLAATGLVVRIELDRAVARLRGVSPCVQLDFELAAPVWRSDELERCIVARLKRQHLEAPSLGLGLEVSALTRQVGVQLRLDYEASGPWGGAGRNAERLPVLCAELAAELGDDSFGVLQVCDTHRPEARSRLVAPVLGERGARRPLGERPARQERRRLQERSARGAAVASAASAGMLGERVERAPTRLLARPVRIAVPLRVGEVLRVGQDLYTIQRLEHERRLDLVEWWSARPLGRDYVRLWLAGSAGGLEVLAFVDRGTGARFLQGIFD